MIYGLDLLGGAKYGKLLLKEFPTGWAAGLFDNTFGPASGLVEKLIETGKCHHIRIQMLWSDTHRFGDSDIKKLKAIAKPYERLALKYPVRIELSPFCEHNLKTPDKYLDIVKNEAPSCYPVNTPWQGNFSKKYKNEIHGNHKKPSGTGKYNYSYDGTNAVDSNVTKDKQTHSNADVFFFWHPRFNLKWNMKDNTPRPKRTGKPSKEMIRSLIYLANDKCQTSIRKNWLIKSHADNHGPTNGKPDQKGDKNLIISPIKSDKILLKTQDGKLVDTLNYYGIFEGGGNRYYSRFYAYQAAETAIKLSGNPLCDIWQKGEKYGTCHPGFRDPTFR